MTGAGPTRRAAHTRATVVALNAHPDDEALLSGGTLAGLASRGHRVVLVTATDGGAGWAARDMMASGRLGQVRLAELRTSAAALGAADVIPLGYADSGHLGEVPPDPPGQRRLVRVPVEEIADRVAAIVRSERADLLLGYDHNGGYHHRDHIHIHHVARAVALQTGVRLLEATVPREPIVNVLRIVERFRTLPNNFAAKDWTDAFSPMAQITHRIDVRPFLGAKRTAMQAHVSQAAGTFPRTMSTLLALPKPVYRLVFSFEHFLDPQLAPRAAGLRGRRELIRDVLT
ncbi:MAG: PIG-L family deacetylase [Ornithinimicrobium sp.]|uniref:PIG-L deacetylase family protein n=1 Tax=Ornithinimicrobium sp. TaxID=1977084 RepID=UPI0026E0EEF0|nr:PIG-L family deacetylase [Ornithinimicrobium sp.]MDO5738854.1 PIG-L family deacetylase [Ornithinimicrobium sp.]